SIRWGLSRNPLTMKVPAASDRMMQWAEDTIQDLLSRRPELRADPEPRLHDARERPSARRIARQRGAQGHPGSESQTGRLPRSDDGARDRGFARDPEALPVASGIVRGARHAARGGGHLRRDRVPG